MMWRDDDDVMMMKMLWWCEVGGQRSAALGIHTDWDTESMSMEWMIWMWRSLPPAREILMTSPKHHPHSSPEHFIPSCCVHKHRHKTPQQECCCKNRTTLLYFQGASTLAFTMTGDRPLQLSHGSQLLDWVLNPLCVCTQYRVFSPFVVGYLSTYQQWLHIKTCWNQSHLTQYMNTTFEAAVFQLKSIPQKI
jgi:hypothetical protein